ncbi:unnamed protein product [[Candida] boidinii]|nr:unnamed protein product [[Candida] boidinii]
MASNTIADENFFAENYGENGYADKNNQNGNGDGDDQFNDNFFNDNDDYGALGYSDDDVDTDGDGVSGGRSTRNDILSQNRGRGRGINFARVAKKVNVKLLKDNLWDSLQEVKNRKQDEAGNEMNQDAGEGDANKENKELSDNDQNINKDANDSNNNNDKVMNELGKIINDNTKELKFTEVVDNMSIKYSREEKSELSTSFCFICLLHLANENGFKIESNKDNTDLFIV